jgi:regulator of RNase E activity RraA
MFDNPLPEIERLPASTIEELRSTRGLSATVSDVLDQLGWSLTVPATLLAPRQPDAVVVGYAITAEYVPTRRRPGSGFATVADVGSEAPPPAFDPGYRHGESGDVLVLAAHGADGTSVLGGRVARAVRRHGIGGVIADGAVRDLDEILAVGLPVWSRGVTPITGKSRLEQVAINRPVFFAGVQVYPGDLVIADRSGVCFVPSELAAELADQVLRAAAAEVRSETQATGEA